MLMNFLFPYPLSWFIRSFVAFLIYNLLIIAVLVVVGALSSHLFLRIAGEFSELRIILADYKSVVDFFTVLRDLLLKMGHKSFAMNPNLFWEATFISFSYAVVEVMAIHYTLRRSYKEFKWVWPSKAVFGSCLLTVGIWSFLRLYVVNDLLWLGGFVVLIYVIWPAIGVKPEEHKQVLKN